MALGVLIPVDQGFCRLLDVQVLRVAKHFNYLDSQEEHQEFKASPCYIVSMRQPGLHKTLSYNKTENTLCLPPHQNDIWITCFIVVLINHTIDRSEVIHQKVRSELHFCLAHLGTLETKLSWSSGGRSDEVLAQKPWVNPLLWEWPRSYFFVKTADQVTGFQLHGPNISELSENPEAGCSL